MLVYYQLLYVLFILLGLFIDFLPLTYGQDAKVAGSCFLLFFVSGKLITKYSPNWKRKLFYEVLHRKTPDARRVAEGGRQGAHTCTRRAWHRCGPPGPAPTPPLRLFIPPGWKTLDIARKSQKEVRSRRHRRRNLSSSRHPAGGEIVTGGLLHHHACLQ